MDAPRVGTRIHKRDHPDGPSSDPYTLQPDGLPMGARRGELPDDLRGMIDLPEDYDLAVNKGWPNLNYSGNKDYENFISAKPVRLESGTDVLIDGQKRTLQAGDKIYRVIDEAARTDGAWWAFELPDGKPEWRRDYAIKDSWNDNGYYVEYEIPERDGPKAWVGHTAGQEYDGNRFYLPGGKTQIMVTPGALETSPVKRTNW